MKNVALIFLLLSSTAVGQYYKTPTPVPTKPTPRPTNTPPYVPPTPTLIPTYPVPGITPTPTPPPGLVPLDVYWRVTFEIMENGVWKVDTQQTYFGSCIEARACKRIQQPAGPPKPTNTPLPGLLNLRGKNAKG